MILLLRSIFPAIKKKRRTLKKKRLHFLTPIWWIDTEQNNHLQFTHSHYIYTRNTSTQIILWALRNKNGTVSNIHAPSSSLPRIQFGKYSSSHDDVAEPPTWTRQRTKQKEKANTLWVRREALGSSIQVSLKRMLTCVHTALARTESSSYNDTTPWTRH